MMFRVSQFRIFGHLLMIRDYTLFLNTKVIFHFNCMILRIFDAVKSFYW